MKTLLFAVLLLGMSSQALAQSDSAATIHVMSADGVETSISDVTRIVSMGGSITEILYALGYGSEVVGADISSNYPPEIKDKPRLGFYRTASSEGILSLNPSVVIGSLGLGPPGVPQQLRAAGVPLLLTEEAKTLEQAYGRFRLIGQAVGKPEAAETMVASVAQALEETRSSTEGLPAPRVLFIYARGAGTVNVAGLETAAHTTIELAGGQNAITGFSQYRPLTAEAVVTAAPDVILMPERGLESIGGVQGLLSLPGVSLTPAAKNGRIITVDDSKLLGFGPRFAEAVHELAVSLFSADELAAGATK